jgi:hypothetical protein
MKKVFYSVSLIVCFASCSKKNDVDSILDTKVSSTASRIDRGGGGSGGNVSFGGVVEMGELKNYLFVFTDGSKDGNWQGASKGFYGSVAIDGQELKEKTSGFVPYSGTIYTSANNLNDWQEIVDDNAGQASWSHSPSVVNDLENSLQSAFSQINSLTVTSGFDGVSATSLDNLNTQNGISETFVINVTSGFHVSSQIDITGDAGDYFILRWDTDRNFANGYDGEVKFQSGGGIVPHGGLTPVSFMHVAGDIASSGGGTTPAAPYPQGPRSNNGAGSLVAGGQDFNGGGFFTGYWLTTGKPDKRHGNDQPYGETGSLSNAVFAGGWFSSTSKFSMTSGTSGVWMSGGN